jgi:hypothetical protein
MIRHQATSPDLSAGLRHRDGESIPLMPIIGIAEQRPLATIAEFRNVVRDPWAFTIVANDPIHSAVLYVASPKGFD